MTNNFILLDAGGALIILPFYFILHLITTVFIEGSVLYLFKYKTYNKCLTDAFQVNLYSLIIGLFLMRPVSSFVYYLCKGNNLYFTLFLYYLITILIEGLTLKLLNKTFPLIKLIAADLLMNLITYITLYIILEYIHFL